MERIPNQRYTEEFKEQAVYMAINETKTKVKAARRLGIPKETLYGWINKYNETGSVTRSGKAVESNDIEAENARLRRELAETKMERDILTVRYREKKRRRTSRKSRTEHGTSFGRNEVRVHKEDATPMPDKNNVPGT